ncbi:hypothetical protein [Paenibacillus sedimenti]|uniref:Uncharacterized protein n=1 Tax=Paenibacillus sedimenti TaxID=2770274 RepID=A0A926KRC8_9BACL|nr:hypothetical protein [Paenibacillus sedimenti]MBD0382545.1 hypothetical protein [Paenibacillus sedimenti]
MRNTINWILFPFIVKGDNTNEIAIVCFDDFTDLDVFLPWDLLNRVRLVGGIADWEVKLLGTEPSHVSMAGFGVKVVNESMVTNGNISAAAGCLAGQDLSSWVIDSLMPIWDNQFMLRLR